MSNLRNNKNTIETIKNELSNKRELRRNHILNVKRNKRNNNINSFISNIINLCNRLAIESKHIEPNIDKINFSLPDEYIKLTAESMLQLIDSNVFNFNETKIAKFLYYMMYNDLTTYNMINDIYLFGINQDGFNELMCIIYAYIKYFNPEELNNPQLLIDEINKMNILNIII